VSPMTNPLAKERLGHMLKAALITPHQFVVDQKMPPHEQCDRKFCLVCFHLKASKRMQIHMGKILHIHIFRGHLARKFKMHYVDHTVQARLL
jgi:hypothetical protein